MSRSRSISFVLAVAIVLAGCRNTFRIHPEELSKLEGSLSGEYVTVRDVRDRPVRLTRRTPLTLVLRDGTRIRTRYEAFPSEGRVLRGRGDDGPLVEGRLEDVVAVDVPVYYPGVTTALVVSGVILLIGLVAFVLWSPSQDRESSRAH